MTKIKRMCGIAAGLFCLVLCLYYVLLPKPVYAAEPTACTITVSKTVVGGSETQKAQTFDFVGKIQGGAARAAVPDDYWYGTSDVIYDNVEIYTAGMPYVKTRTDDGSVIETGTVSPNGYGIFHLELKDNETISFTVQKTGDAGIYLFETPQEPFETESVMNGQTFSGTTNVATGEVIGVGAIPGGMETRYYTENASGITKEFAPKLLPLTGDISVNFINTAPTYQAAYSFESGTDGKELPSDVTALLPETTAGLADESSVTPEQPAKTEVAVTGGKWTFSGYSPASAQVSGGDLSFVGTWTFAEDPVTPAPPTPTPSTPTQGTPVSSGSGGQSAVPSSTPASGLSVISRPRTAAASLEESAKPASIAKESRKEMRIIDHIDEKSPKEKEAALSRPAKTEGSDIYFLPKPPRDYSRYFIIPDIVLGLSLLWLLLRIRSDAELLIWYDRKKRRNEEKR